MATYTSGVEQTAPFALISDASAALIVIIDTLDSTSEKVLGTGILMQGSMFIGYVIYGA
jgi:hypothetical protein